MITRGIRAGSIAGFEPVTGGDRQSPGLRSRSTEVTAHRVTCERAAALPGRLQAKVKHTLPGRQSLPRRRLEQLQLRVIVSRADVLDITRPDGWATKFLDAGAAAFIGSLWAVSDGAAREFAQEVYRQLQAGSSLGKAVMQARHIAASQPDDPTWLAYTVYGDPRATVSRRP